jgi:hypothetical protein
MRIANATWIAAGLVAASAAVAFWAWQTLPAGGGVPVNVLGLDGVRRRTVSREGVWLMPFVAGMVTLGLTGGALRTRGVERAREVFDMTMISVTGLLLVTQIALVSRAFDAEFNVMRPVAIATGVLLIAVGNYLGKARQNAFIGIKTPWTLADATVWDKTHRFTGRAMFAGGLALMLLGFVFRDGALLGVSIAACTALPMLAGIARSRSLYRTLQRGLAARG